MMSTRELAEILLLARHASPREFMALMEALRQPLRVPTSNINDALLALEKMADAEKEEAVKSHFG